MRAFILALGLTCTFGLTACEDPGESQAVEDYEEATEGPIEEEFTEDDITDSDDALIGTGGYDAYDTDDDGLLSVDEYDAGIGDGAFGTYDTDADGYLNDEEYGVYESTLTM
jgi:hypothetical protein